MAYIFRNSDLSVRKLCPFTLRLLTHAHSNMGGTSDGLEKITGTTVVFQDDQAEVVLHPPPTDSPNDPLNWSWKRRYWSALLVCFYTGLTAATANNAGCASDGARAELGIPYEVFNDSAGVLFAGIGYFAPFIAPLATLYGRRIGYLVSMILGLIGSIWFALSMTVGDTIGNQLFIGMSESASQTNVQLSLIDIFYSHRLGTALSIYVLATSIGTFLGPLIGGYVAGGPLGWRWVAWLGTIFYAVSLVVFYFGLEETYFDREGYLRLWNSWNHAVDTPGVPVNVERSADIGIKGEKTASKVAERPVTRTPTGDIYPERVTTPNWNFGSGQLIHDGKDPTAPKSYRERIALITPASNLKGWGTKQYFTLLIQSFRVFTFPAVIFSGLQWGAQDAWLTFYLTTEDELWSNEPWNYSNYGVALMNIPCLIGAIIGCLYSGPLSDKFVLWMAKRNKGIKEAEFRLYLGLINLIVSPAGLLIFGIGSARGWAWQRPYIGLGLIGFGWGCAGDIAMSYLVDCYPEMVIEGMVGVAIINNSLGMIFTFVCNDFIDAAGTENTYIIIGVLQFFCVVLSIPLIIWGKAIRKWTTPSYRRFVKIRDGLNQNPATLARSIRATLYPKAYLDSVPHEIIVSVLEQCDTTEDALALCSTSKKYKSIWDLYRASIATSHARRHVPAFEDALITIRATAIARENLEIMVNGNTNANSARTPREIIPSHLSYKCAKPTFDEIRKVNDLYRFVDGIIQLAKKGNPKNPDPQYELKWVFALDVGQPHRYLLKKLDEVSPSPVDVQAFRQRVFSSFYRVFLAGAMLSSGYLRPFLQAGSPLHYKSKRTAAKLPLESDEVEHLKGFELYNIPPRKHRVGGVKEFDTLAEYIVEKEHESYHPDCAELQRLSDEHRGMFVEQAKNALVIKALMMFQTAFKIVRQLVIDRPDLGTPCGRGLCTKNFKRRMGRYRPGKHGALELFPFGSYQPQVFSLMPARQPRTLVKWPIVKSALIKMGDEVKEWRIIPVAWFAKKTSVEDHALGSCYADLYTAAIVDTDFIKYAMKTYCDVATERGDWLDILMSIRAEYIRHGFGFYNGISYESMKYWLPPPFPLLVVYMDEDRWIVS
ncbi:hypothetical protein Dda_2305 [Drechslerella dactyloides]|uniref:Major facilitator superfamily (MFS) profile domain-containing protein n=1 Tax=Drechslerella dactyloides TaxID=74499 RepID=A0AAD6J3M8_DREDA|nr:hypothetical protein Dda_2305 [Drechslerella dactyloides]